MALRSQDRIKLQAAGFKIFRREENRLKIKICNDNCEWSTFKKCSTKQELKESMIELLSMNLCIEDV